MFAGARRVVPLPRHRRRRQSWYANRSSRLVAHGAETRTSRQPVDTRRSIGQPRRLHARFVQVLAELKKQREKAKADLDRIDRAIVALAGPVSPVGGPAKQVSRPARSRRGMSAVAWKGAGGGVER